MRGLPSIPSKPDGAGCIVLAGFAVFVVLIVLPVMAGLLVVSTVCGIVAELLPKKT